MTPDPYWGSVWAPKLVVDNQKRRNHQAMRELFGNRLIPGSEQRSLDGSALGESAAHVGEVVQDLVPFKFAAIEAIYIGAAASLDRIFYPSDVYFPR